ncbi:hypothetical protein OGAPHI_001294 [Ogataea philodendri]|uniref:Sulfiredoxin n=1 Tax=Ogataea philodendri TaxID=1378263 RepID=A0A9P8PEG9_9ASCO|nr:uncharacterized protein OGAPHI_001294 [Ogataea philodendri]KAH3670778.1 hypothetical protein OGAPHI_001294 [Ogataea philodendri]
MSLQTRSLQKVELIPLSQIIRPIPPVLDYSKIDTMVSTLGGNPMASATCKLEDITPGELPPIDVLVVSDKGNKKYFAFGGCHRFQAYEKSETPMVRCKVLPCTKKQLSVYLGSSVDKFFES